MAALVAFEDVRAVAAIRIPDTYAAIGAAAGQEPARAVQRHIRYWRAMTLRSTAPTLAQYCHIDPGHCGARHRH